MSVLIADSFCSGDDDIRYKIGRQGSSIALRALINNLSSWAKTAVMLAMTLQSKNMALRSWPEADEFNAGAARPAAASLLMSSR